MLTAQYTRIICVCVGLMAGAFLTQCYEEVSKHYRDHLRPAGMIGFADAPGGCFKMPWDRK